MKQLVTHTTGLGYWFWSEEIKRWEAVTGTPNVLSGSNVIFTAPLLADPGTTFTYGINTDWLGKVIEAAGGVALDVAVKEGITGPLGMNETEFRLAEGGRRPPPRCTSRARTGSGTRPASSSTRSRSTTRAGTGCTRRRATTSGSSGRCWAAASWTACAS